MILIKSTINYQENNNFMLHKKIKSYNKKEFIISESKNKTLEIK